MYGFFVLTNIAIFIILSGTGGSMKTTSVGVQEQVVDGVVSKFNPKDNRGTVKLPNGDKPRFELRDCNPPLNPEDVVVGMPIRVFLAPCGTILRLTQDIANC
jgi:hypothetical protein